MVVADSPCMVMFSDIKKFGHISNIALAQTLLDENIRYGEDVLGNRLLDRTFLTRKVVQTDPGQLPASWFREYSLSTQEVVAKMVKRPSNSTGLQQIIEHYSGSAADEMKSALEAYNLDGSVYANAVSFIGGMKTVSESDHAVLLTALFIVTGCTGNADTAASYVRQLAQELTGDGFRTKITVNESGAPHADLGMDTDIHLGAARIIDNRMKPHIYPLDTGPAGTIIGALPEGAGSITDVGTGVSKRHARIFRNAEGRWFVQDLGSTNGTVLVSGVDNSELEIAPSDGKRHMETDPVEVFPGDILKLAGTTDYMILAVLSEHA